MQQKLILENWRKFLKEEVDELTRLQQQTSKDIEDNAAVKTQPTEEEKKEAVEETIVGSLEHSIANAKDTAKKSGISLINLQNKLVDAIRKLVSEGKNKRAKVVKKKVVTVAQE